MEDMRIFNLLNEHVGKNLEEGVDIFISILNCSCYETMEMTFETLTESQKDAVVIAYMTCMLISASKAF